jgi:hypothetical protein
MQLYNFDQIHRFLTIEEEKSMWAFLSDNDMKLKNIRFFYKSCPIGSAIFISDKNGNQLLDITDYSKW